jgi:3-deoxy-D-manno-octulosonate 8-phosphate phosphatase KdsC-like HAD superfamily phosphatase
MLDVYGVWFTAEDTRSVDGTGTVQLTRTRSLHDAQGLSFLRALGIHVLFVTKPEEPLMSIVKKINQLPSVTSGAWTPVEVFEGPLDAGSPTASAEAWLKVHGLTWADVVYIGDDRTDIELMSLAGLKVVPGDARRVVQRTADVTLTASGGRGAIREFAEMVLDARGIDEATLPAA